MALGRTTQGGRVKGPLTKMTIQHSNFYGPLIIDRLQMAEQTLGMELPTQYRQFLLEHNGGIPDPSCFIVPGDEEYDRVSSERQMACFFALHDQEWNDDTPEGSLGFPLQEAWNDFQRDVPKSDAVPIGKDWNGSYICLSYRGEEQGRVFFYDHDYEELRPLAEDFPAFLLTLRACEEG